MIISRGCGLAIEMLLALNRNGKSSVSRRLFYWNEPKKISTSPTAPLVLLVWRLQNGRVYMANGKHRMHGEYKKTPDVLNVIFNWNSLGIDSQHNGLVEWYSKRQGSPQICDSTVIRELPNSNHDLHTRTIIRTSSTLHQCGSLFQRCPQWQQFMWSLARA